MLTERQTRYRDYLKSEDWQKKRKQKKPKQCGICLAHENLDVHHIHYRNLVDVQMSDLRVLCRRCHTLYHRLYDAGRIKYASDSHHSRWATLKAAVLRELHSDDGSVFSDPITAKATPNGGYTREQLAEWGIPWPPPKGWKKRLLETR